MPEFESDNGGAGGTGNPSSSWPSSFLTWSRGGGGGKGRDAENDVSDHMVHEDGGDAVDDADVECDAAVVAMNDAERGEMDVVDDAVDIECEVWSRRSSGS